MKSRRKFTKEFKQTAVRRLNGGQSVAEVARALEVHPSDLHHWNRELQEHGERAFNGDQLAVDTKNNRRSNLQMNVRRSAIHGDFENPMKQFHEGKLAEVEEVPIGKVIPRRTEMKFSLLTGTWCVLRVK